MTAHLVRAEHARAKAAHMLRWIALAYLVILVVNLFGPDTWADSISPLGVQGFYVNPRAVEQTVAADQQALDTGVTDAGEELTDDQRASMSVFVSLVDSDMALAAAPLCHSLPFLFLVICIGGYVNGIPLSRSTGIVSRARGAGLGEMLAARTVVMLAYFMGSFIVYSTVMFPVLAWVTGAAITQSLAIEFLKRLALCVLVCSAFVVLTTCVVSTFGRGTYVLGTLALFMFLGYTNPNLLYMHISALERICAPVPLDEFASQMVSFSFVSTLAAGLAAYVIARVRQARA